MVGRGIMVYATLLLLGANDLMAACVQANAAGTWKTYSMYVEEVRAFWNRCTVTVGATGVVNTAMSTCTDSSGQTARLTAGRVVVTADCRVSGRLVIGGKLNTLTDGQLSRDFLTFTGVGRFPGGVFQVTGVKR